MVLVEMSYLSTLGLVRLTDSDVVSQRAEEGESV